MKPTVSNLKFAQHKFRRHGFHLTIDEEIDDGSGCGSGGEARPSPVVLLFDDFSGELVDLLFSYSGESDRIITLSIMI